MQSIWFDTKLGVFKTIFKKGFIQKESLNIMV